MRDLSEKTLKSRLLHEGRRLRLEELQVRLPDGRIAWREVVRHPGAVAILALLSTGQAERVLLVRQYRKAVERALWEVPAGTLEPPETPLACARRELLEETGYRARTLEEMARFYTTPGFTDEQMTLFRAQGLQPAQGAAHPQPEDERLEVRGFTLEEVEGLIASGQIHDAKTLLALALWRAPWTPLRPVPQGPKG